MSDETKVEDAEAPAGMAALGALTEEGGAAEAVAAAPGEGFCDAVAHHVHGWDEWTCSTRPFGGAPFPWPRRSDVFCWP